MVQKPCFGLLKAEWNTYQWSIAASFVLALCCGETWLCAMPLYHSSDADMICEIPLQHLLGTWWNVQCLLCRSDQTGRHYCGVPHGRRMSSPLRGSSWNRHIRHAVAELHFMKGKYGMNWRPLSWQTKTCDPVAPYSIVRSPKSKEKYEKDNKEKQKYEMHHCVISVGASIQLLLAKQVTSLASTLCM